MVGNSKDRHGCLVSAGYRWSESKQDCVRLWEAGKKYTYKDKHLFLLFSNDSMIAEIFTDDGKHILCKKDKNENIWTASKYKTRILVNNGKVSIELGEEIYTAYEVAE